MEQIIPLLQELAAKLGTTTEYLWEVLIKQAQISIISSVLQLIAGIILLITGFNILKESRIAGKANHNN